MAILNLGLQCVGAREKMPEEFEKEVAKCNNLTELKKIAERKDQIVGAVKDIAYHQLRFCSVASFLVCT